MSKENGEKFIFTVQRAVNLSNMKQRLNIILLLVWMMTSALHSQDRGTSIPGGWSDSLCNAMKKKAISDGNSGKYYLFHQGIDSSWPINSVILEKYNIELEDRGDIQNDDSYYNNWCYKKIMDSIIRDKFPKEIFHPEASIHQSEFNDRIHFKDEFFFLTDSTTREINKKLFVNMLKGLGIKPKAGHACIY